ncbi:MAG: class I SAM-dependent methyltransferase [Leptospira sp.]|nr:class I SAM-dependent methyltransferase [Leptospira sp.]
MNKSTKEIWDSHYNKEKSRLKYPDENLVRMLSGIGPANGEALDFGAGSGRHSILLQNFGYKVTSCDYSENSINQLRELSEEISACLISQAPYPFPDKKFQVVVSWGVLHYNSIETSKKIIAEYKRMLSPGGYLLGTIRSNEDTHLKAKDGKIGLSDLKDSEILLFSLEEIQELLSPFKEVLFGYSERRPVGKLNERICHWIFQAKN